MNVPWCWMPVEILDDLIGLAERATGPWPESAALADLIRKQDLCILKGRPMMAYRDLAKRWRWTETKRGGFTEGRARSLLADESRWADPRKADAWDRLRRQRKLNADSTQVQRTANADSTAEAAESESGQRTDNADSTHGQRTDNDTGAFFTTTSTTTTTDESCAPVGQPSGRKPKASKPKPDHAADLLLVLEALRLIDPKRAEKAIAGGNTGIVSAATLAIRGGPRTKGMGAAAVAARLRYVAEHPEDGGVKAWRSYGADPMSLFVVTGRMVNGWDDAAAMAAPVEHVDHDPEAVAAWASMSLRHDFRLLRMGSGVVQPQNFGSRSGGVELADDGPEHARRWTAWRAAGGTGAWAKIANDHDRHAFRHAFLIAYAANALEPA